MTAPCTRGWPVDHRFPSGPTTVIAENVVCKCSLNVALTWDGPVANTAPTAGSVRMRVACADAVGAAVSARTVSSTPSSADAAAFMTVAAGLAPVPPQARRGPVRRRPANVRCCRVPVATRPARRRASGSSGSVVLDGRGGHAGNGVGGGVPFRDRPQTMWRHERLLVEQSTAHGHRRRHRATAITTNTTRQSASMIALPMRTSV